MTTRSKNAGPHTKKRVEQFPDPPPEEMTAFHQVNLPGYPGILLLHFQDREGTIVSSEVAAGLRLTESYEGILYPDLLIAFGVDSAASVARNGYLISEQGKSPDFVLEVASPTTAHRDETVKRDGYRRMGVGEYWRFDPTGGELYETALAGDRLVDREWEAVVIEQTVEGHHWGWSEALGLALCWEDGNLRFWDGESGSYLPTVGEQGVALRAEAEARRMAEGRAETAEAEVRRLRRELGRRSE